MRPTGLRSFIIQSFYQIFSTIVAVHPVCSPQNNHWVFRSSSAFSLCADLTYHSLQHYYLIRPANFPATSAHLLHIISFFFSGILDVSIARLFLTHIIRINSLVIENRFKKKNNWRLFFKNSRACSKNSHEI